MFRLTEFHANGEPADPRSESGDVEFDVFTDSPAAAPLEELSGACRRLRDAPQSAAVLLPPASPGTLAAAWKVLPPEIAVLLEAPTAVGWVILPRTDSNAGQRGRIGRDEVWQVLAALVDEGSVSLEFLDAAREEVRADIAAESEGVLQRLAPRDARHLPAEIESRVERWLEDATSGSSGRVPERIAIQAGLLQWHDRLDASHHRSQSIEGEGLNQDGDYWHAIMHRREPDYSNAKYWFRQLGRHPLLGRLPGIADEVLATCSDGGWRSRLASGGRWNAPAFVELCATCADGEESPLGLAARRIQRAEMLLLLEQSCADAGC